MLKYFEQHFLGLAFLNVSSTDHLTYYCLAKTFIDLTSIFICCPTAHAHALIKRRIVTLLLYKLTGSLGAKACSRHRQTQSYLIALGIATGFLIAKTNKVTATSSFRICLVWLLGEQ